MGSGSNFVRDSGVEVSLHEAITGYLGLSGLSGFNAIKKLLLICNTNCQSNGIKSGRSFEAAWH